MIHLSKCSKMSLKTPASVTSCYWIIIIINICFLLKLVNVKHLNTVVKLKMLMGNILLINVFLNV